jgi:hypothetical protein
MIGEYILMHKNKEVAILTIELVEYGKKDLRLHVDQILDAFYLPFGTKAATGADIDQLMTLWYNERSSSFGRPNHAYIFEEYGIDDCLDLLSISHMCSLTDCYWFKSVRSRAKWNDVSFYRKGFDESIGQALFHCRRNSAVNDFNSPDLTTDGALPKTWMKNADGKFVLLKGSKLSTAASCYEVLADLIFTDLGIDHIPYHLEQIGKITASACECIISSDKEELVPIECLMRDANCIGQANFLPTIRHLGFGKELDEMIFGDCIIGNRDRHARNYCIVIDSDTQEIKRFATLFDHGDSVWHQSHGHIYYPPTGASFNKTIPMLPKELLRQAERIDVGRVAAAVQDMPISDLLKGLIVEQLEDRITKILAFANR